MAAKRLELLKEAAPNISRIAILWDSGALHEDPSLEGQRKAAESLGVTLLIHDITDAHDEATFAALLSAVESEAPDALFIYPNFIAAKHAAAILAFASSHRLPAMVQDTALAERGALLSHYADWDDLRRRTAEYVDKIFKGSAPADLPIEQPKRFDLVVNLTTAKALGVTIPQSILLRADKVIE